MRRRKVPAVRDEERPTLLLMAAGAVAGAAAGLYLGRRYRSMDAFLDDMRDRLASLREIWNDDELPPARRARLGMDAVDDVDEDEDDYEELEEREEEEEDEIDESPYASASSFDDDDDDSYDDEDAFDDELAGISSDNGVSEAALRADEKARRLEERVLRELRDEPVLGSRSIEIAVVGDGVVELTGTVHAIEEVSRAAALVRGVPGVSMVLNRIEVRMGGSMDTASVARDPLEAPAPEERA